MKIKLSFMALLIGISLIFVPAAAEEEIPLPRTELPILVTSCGQSPGATMLKVILKRANLPEDPPSYNINPLASAEDLEMESGPRYRTLIIVMGASLKGMGAAGISIKDEIDRTTALIEAARKQGICVIGAHIEGMKRRAQGASAGDSTDEQSIDAVAPFSDLLLIHKEGNLDRRFTLIAGEKNLPLIEVEKNLDLVDIFKKLFSE